MNTTHLLATGPGGSPSHLHAAVHWRVDAPFAFDAPDLLDKVELMGNLAGSQLAATARAADFAPQALVVVSTVMSTAVTMNAATEARFADAVQAACGVRPQGVLNAYMCTGWGWALRHFMRHTAVQRLAIAIVDLDIHNLEWQREHPVIGPSGFGVTTLFFTWPADNAGVPCCSGPHPNAGFKDFIVALRKHQVLNGVQPTFIPFTLAPLAATAQRVLAAGSLGPNRNAEYGHCFGADPWIGIIEGGPAALAAAGGHEARVLAGAVAFNGYYTHAQIALGADTLLAFSRLAGDSASLHHAIDAAAAESRRGNPLHSLI